MLLLTTKLFVMVPQERKYFLYFKKSSHIFCVITFLSKGKYFCRIFISRFLKSPEILWFLRDHIINSHFIIWSTILSISLREGFQKQLMDLSSAHLTPASQAEGWIKKTRKLYWFSGWIRPFGAQYRVILMIRIN